MSPCYAVMLTSPLYDPAAWEEAYPKGAEPTEGLRLFADDIRCN